MHSKRNKITGIQKWIGVSLLFLLCLNNGFGQDFHFTQFYSNKLYLAPSMAGVNIQNRVISNYRNQWQGVNGYSTYSVSYDHNFQKYNSGLGVLLMQDRAGDGNLMTQYGGLHYSYDFAITQGFHFRPGVSLSVMKRGIDFYKLYFSSQISPETLETESQGLNGANSTFNMDATASGLVYTRNIMLGLSVDHLMKPNLSFLSNEDKLQMKYSLFSVVTLYRQGKLIKPIDETISIAAILSGLEQFNQLDVGIYWAKIPLILGLWYRGIPIVNSDRGDSFSFLAGFKVRKFTFGYSYDLPVSNLQVNKTYGTHEISIAVEFAKAGNTRRRKMQRVPCPDL